MNLFPTLIPLHRFDLRKSSKKRLKIIRSLFLISSHDLKHDIDVRESIFLSEKGLPIKDLASDSKIFNQLEEYFKTEMHTKSKFFQL